MHCGIGLYSIHSPRLFYKPTKSGIFSGQIHSTLKLSSCYARFHFNGRFDFNFNIGTIRSYVANEQVSREILSKAQGVRALKRPRNTAL